MIVAVSADEECVDEYSSNFERNVNNFLKLVDDESNSQLRFGGGFCCECGDDDDCCDDEVAIVDGEWQPEWQQHVL